MEELPTQGQMPTGMEGSQGVLKAVIGLFSGSCNVAIFVQSLYYSAISGANTSCCLTFIAQ